MSRATKSFLSNELMDQANESLIPFFEPPDGDERKSLSLSPQHFSTWLGSVLENQMKVNSHWINAGPVALGSWARGELCPQSDIDLLFCGDEKSAAQVVANFQSQGLKVRSRLPQDLKDWTVGVNSFDILTLLEARALVPKAQEPLLQQQRRIWEKRSSLRKNLLADILSERKARNLRYDSISNFLEPNIKYGPGGLRDIGQGLQIYLLFSEKFAQSDHALQVLKYYKTFFLLLRQKLHLSSHHSDSVAAAEQVGLAQWFGYKSLKDFMREIQKGLQRGLFYSNYIVEVARSSEAVLTKWRKTQVPNFQKAFELLKKNPGQLNQYKVRLELDGSLSKHQKLPAAARVKLVKELTSAKSTDAFLVAVFDSRLIDRLVPEIKRLVGYVQHDQYHRFSADAHILQVMRELKRLRARPTLLGRLNSLVAGLSARDWDILQLAALYHDLGKGLGGDHSHKSLDLLKRDFKGAWVSEVAWLVEHHLILSEAAFRRNPRAVSTWEYLQKTGLTPERLKRLCLFTLADIKGTNPEAWNDWKEKLMYDLVAQMFSGASPAPKSLAHRFSKHKIFIPPTLAERLDPFLVEQLPMTVWKSELSHLSKMTPVQIYPGGKDQKWIRFYRPADQQGLFLEFVSQLFATGVDVLHALVMTVPDWGVYDWFKVRTTQSLPRLEQSLGASAKAVPSSAIKVSSVDLLSCDEDEWVVSFKGQDQRGFLYNVTKALAETGSEISWAKLHTWGRSVDDVFGITPQNDKTAFLALLKNRLLENPLV